MRPSLTPQIIAPPPLLYLAVFILSLALHAVAPQPLYLSDGVAPLMGATLALVSAIVARWTFVIMKAGTRAKPHALSATLIRSGPFTYSRHPIYVAMTGLYLGMALLVGSAWPFWFVVPLLAAMHWGVVLREEQ